MLWVIVSSPVTLDVKEKGYIKLRFSISAKARRRRPPTTIIIGNTIATIAREEGLVLASKFRFTSKVV